MSSKKHTIIVGRENSCDVVLPFKSVSRRHIEVSRGSEAHKFKIRDLNSKLGTFVQGRRVQTATVFENDFIQLGDQVLSVAQVVGDHLTGGSAGGAQVIVVGRAPEVDILVDLPMVSGRHLQLMNKDGHVVIQDLGATNGTFVNGFRIKDNVILKASDRLSLGSYQIPSTTMQSWMRRVRGGAAAVGHAPLVSKVAKRLHVKPGEGVRLDLMDLSRVVTTSDGTPKQILDRVGASIYPGEMVALMGPSGAGKTTLLELLTDQAIPSAGKVLVNGKSLESDLSILQELVGFVPQEDVMHRDLTVRECLYYTARLRLPPQTSDQEIDQRIGQVLTQMGIADVADTVIGGEHVRGVSGGQRKRVNIAMELLTGPPVLLLDEPTSGLDSTSTLKVLEVLRQLANTGTTVVMTIHQPRKEAFDLLDMVILLAKGGKLAYFGPTNMAATYLGTHTRLPFNPEMNPADYVIDVLDPVDDTMRLPPSQWQSLFRDSEVQSRYVSQRQVQSSSSLTSPTKSSAHKKTPLGQFSVLLGRYHHRKAKDLRFMVTSMVWPILLGLVFGLICRNGDISGCPATPGGKAHTALFLLVVAGFFFACTNVARELVAERPVFKRELRGGLSPGASIFSIFVWQVTLCLLQMAVMAFVVWAVVGLKWSAYPKSVLLLTLTGSTGIAIGLFISAISKTEVAAVSWVPMVLIPQLILAGVIEPYKSLGGGKVLAALVPIRWGFESVLRTVYGAYSEPCFVSINERMGYPEMSSTGNAFILIVMLCLFLVWAYMISARQGRGAHQAKQDALQRYMQNQESHLVEETKVQTEKAAEQAQTVLARLTALDGPMKGHRFEIKDPQCTAGRDADRCKLAFPAEGADVAISRVHAEFKISAGSWTVTCMSDGGMIVNQTPIQNGEQSPVQMGDSIQMGKTWFRFEGV